MRRLHLQLFAYGNRQRYRLLSKSITRSTTSIVLVAAGIFFQSDDRNLCQCKILFKSACSRYTVTSSEKPAFSETEDTVAQRGRISERQRSIRRVRISAREVDAESPHRAIATRLACDPYLGAICQEVQDRTNLIFADGWKLSGHFSDTQRLEVSEHRGNRHAGPTKHPRAAHLSRQAFQLRTLRPIDVTWRGVGLSFGPN